MTNNPVNCLQALCYLNCRDRQNIDEMLNAFKKELLKYLIEAT